jgi:hypothetical protein
LSNSRTNQAQGALFRGVRGTSSLTRLISPRRPDFLMLKPTNALSWNGSPLALRHIHAGQEALHKVIVPRFEVVHFLQYGHALVASQWSENLQNKRKEDPGFAPSLLDRLRERLKTSTIGASKGDHREPFSTALLDRAEDPLVSGALDPHGMYRSPIRAVKHQAGVHGDATVTTFRSG